MNNENNQPFGNPNINSSGNGQQSVNQGMVNNNSFPSNNGVSAPSEGNMNSQSGNTNPAMAGGNPNPFGTVQAGMPNQNTSSTINQVPPTSPVNPVEMPGLVQNPTMPVDNNDTQKNPKKKKSGGKILIILFVLILLGVGGYFAYTKFFANNDKEQESKKETTFVLKKEDESKDYVYEADYTSIIDFDQNAGSCPISKTSLKVPYINLNSEDAKTINSEIKALYEQAVGKYRANVTLDNQDPCTNIEMAYKYYQNDNVASIVVAYAESTTATPNPEFYTYNISTETGNLIKDYKDIKKISNQAQMTDEEVGNLVKTMSLSKLTGTTDAESYASKTVDHYNTTLADGSIKFYLHDNKNLGFILVQYTSAGSGEYNTMFPLS